MMRVLTEVLKYLGDLLKMQASHDRNHTQVTVWGALVGVLTEYPIIHTATRVRLQNVRVDHDFQGKDTNRLRSDHKVHTLSRYNMISTIFLALVRSSSKTQVVDHRLQMPTRDPTGGAWRDHFSSIIYIDKDQFE